MSDLSRSQMTARLAASLASDHLPLHGPFVIHLCKRVVTALEDDPAALTRLVEAAEAVKARMGELPGLEATHEAGRLATVRSLTEERFNGPKGRLS